MYMYNVHVEAFYRALILYSKQMFNVLQLSRQKVSISLTLGTCMVLFQIHEHMASSIGYYMAAQSDTELINLELVITRKYPHITLNK